MIYMPDDDNGTPPQVAHPTDPRVQMAAERTFLAWVRTGLTMMAFGFMVARFAVFLETMRGQESPNHSVYPSWIGLGLVLIGVITELAAAVEYNRYCRSVGARNKISHSSWLFAMFTTFVLTVLGIAIGIYLYVSTFQA